MIIKISDHNNIGITSLFLTDFEALSYTKELNGIGSMSFIVRVDNLKITQESLRAFNRVEFTENSKVRFNGFISQVDIGLETIQVKVVGLLGILKVRVSDFNGTLNGTLNDCVQQMIDKANSVEDTLIRTGDLAGTGNVNRTTNGDDIYSILDDMVSGNSNQFVFNHETKELSVRPLVGQNLSNDVILRYDTRIIQLSNLSAFSVTDKSDAVTTVAYGRVGSSNLSTDDSALIGKYGRIERNKSYRALDNSALADQLASELSESEYSPEFTLAPSVEDNFDVGDILGIKLYNRIIDVDTVFQVLEKQVDYAGSEKAIRIRVNKKQTDLLDIIKRHEKQINSLNNHL